MGMFLEPEKYIQEVMIYTLGPWLKEMVFAYQKSRPHYWKFTYDSCLLKEDRTLSIFKLSDVCCWISHVSGSTQVTVFGMTYLCLVVLGKTLQRPLDCKKTQPVHPKGDQSWVFIGRTDIEAETPVLWLPHAKSWLIGKDPNAGKDWGQEENGMTEEEMAGWHHHLNGHGFG